VGRSYRGKGFACEDANALRLSLHYALPRTLTLLAESPDGEALGTLTVIPDSPLGLPMEDSFGPEVEALRRAGRRPCEFTALALEKGPGALRRRVIMDLFRLAGLYARFGLKATDCCCVVNPKHECYYRRVFRYETFGSQRACRRVNGAPGVALRFDCAQSMDQLRRKHACLPDVGSLYEFFLGDNASDAIKRLTTLRLRMSAAEFRYFFFEKTALWQKATARQRTLLRQAFDPKWTRVFGTFEMNAK